MIAHRGAFAGAAGLVMPFLAWGQKTWGLAGVLRIAL